MTSSFVRACIALLLATPLLLASCSRAAPVKATATPAPKRIAADDEAIAGTYTCVLRMGSEKLRGDCFIAEADDGLQLRMELGPHRLQGALTTASYGFRLQGRFGEEPVAIDFLRQGGKSYAAVLQLADQRLGKIDMAPKTETSGPTDS